MARIIDMAEPLAAFLPEVKAPEKSDKLTFKKKCLWTVFALMVYLVCSQVPLYGITSQRNADPFYIMRMILASRGGSLMELGISPIITSGMIMQLLAGAKIIDVDQNIPDDRKKFNAASKLLGVLICLGEALAYVLSGMYGHVSDIGTTTAVLLVSQLFMGGMLVLVLDDLLAKGWGLGSGINLFIVTNICESVVWRCFSPTTFNVGKGTEFEGAVIAFFHLLLTRSNKARALYDAFFRTNLPNLTNLLATVLVLLVVVYIQGFKIEIPVRPKDYRGAPQPYPIKLFYTSNMPIILLSALVANLYFFSQLLFRRYPTNILVRMLGRWDESDGGNRPVGGLSYYVSPPGSFADVVADPFHAVFYIVFMLFACALFAKTWVEISGTGPTDVARQLRDQKVIITGYRDKSMVSVLKRVIPTAAAFGGMLVAALSIFADLLGAIGSGTGLLMSVSIIYELFERVAKESGGKPLSQLFDE